MQGRVARPAGATAPCEDVPQGASRRAIALAPWAWLVLALTPPRTAAAADLVDVEIKGHLFVPETVTAKPGTTVRWTNREKRTSHSVLFPAESLESERLLPDEQWSRRFDKPGRHAYTCGPHPEMKGSVVVSE